ncbi:hypothetical protein [Streptomyces sp. ST2-7A]|uniref:hypothetical protein n=1 Tax=Streptomyces sp. ST2-7A TaxID=2907214 RepID=UPI001F2EC2A4|nr:hypothetical protein [Streptomyces sp. ST2-7A]MCE7082247.1 hypothetical protein [Streptomyces sp. ST2-7A]
MNPLFGSPHPTPSDGGSETICSAKGCRAAATLVLAWNNPKLHTPGRRKTWVTCEEHREHLSTFLGARGFLRETVPLAEWREREENTGDTGGPPVGP